MILPELLTLLLREPMDRMVPSSTVNAMVVTVAPSAMLVTLVNINLDLDMAFASLAKTNLIMLTTLTEVCIFLNALTNVLVDSTLLK